MFAFPNMFHFFTHKFARLGGRRQTFAFVFSRPFDWFFFWHNKIVSPLTAHLDVMKTASGGRIYAYCGRRDADFAEKDRQRHRHRKGIAIPRRGRIGSGHAHNSDNYSDYSVTRRSANLAV